MMPNTFFRRYPLSVLTACVVVFLSTFKFGDLPELADVPLADKWTHGVMYGGLSAVVWWEYLRQHIRVRLLPSVAGAWLIPVLLGGLMELVQGLLPYRSCDVWDFVANSIGAILATAIALIYIGLHCNRWRC